MDDDFAAGALHTSPWSNQVPLRCGRRTTTIDRYPHHPLSERVWELRPALSAYDATYVALAEALDATLVTTDARLARVGDIQAAVEVH